MDRKTTADNVPMYCISLDRRPDRWAEFQARAKHAGLEGRVGRWSAVDAKTFDTTTHPQVSVGTAHNIRFKVRRSHYEIDTPGAVGASLSHFGVWTRIAESGVPGVVFEDDCAFPDGFLEGLHKVFADLPPGADSWDVIMFHETDYDGTGAGCKPIEGEEPWHLCTSLFGAHAYMVSSAGAKKLLRRAYPIELHVDAYMAYMCRMGDIRMMWHPALQMPSPDLDSDINHGGGRILQVPTDMTRRGLVVLDEFSAVGVMAAALIAGGLLGLAFFRGRGALFRL